MRFWRGFVQIAQEALKMALKWAKIGNNPIRTVGCYTTENTTENTTEITTENTTEPDFCAK